MLLNDYNINNKTTVSGMPEEYDMEDSGTTTAKIKSIDEYPDPNASDPTKTVQFPAFKTAGSSFSKLFRFSPYDNILTDAGFASVRQDYEPTIANLLNRRKAKYTGTCYDLSDFLYCKNSEEVSGYHMITLRRFSYPIGDGLWFETKSHKRPDVGRLVGYSTEETNKLSELLSMSFGLNWKELTADFWTPEVIGNDSGASGLLGTLFEITNPMYLQSKGLGKNAINVDPHHDQNKVYGPVDSITKTHIRDRGLNFSHELNLTFEYELKSYQGINGRTALLDLISNILVVTFNDAKFWGGAIHWRGIRRTAFHHYMTAASALRAGQDFNSTIQYYKSQMNSLLGEGTPLQKLMNLAGILLQGMKGFVLDKIVSTLGRPSVMVTNSLLSGEDVGPWHVTIGNPFRPIVAMGNMILTGTQLSFGDELGIDGFPTTMKVVCTLKHARPRSRAEIEKMFNQGMRRTYWQPSKAYFKKMIKQGYALRGIEDVDVLNELSNEIYTFMDNKDITNWYDTKKQQHQQESQAVQGAENPFL
jgi:hypothetical protein